MPALSATANDPRSTSRFRRKMASRVSSLKATGAEGWAVSETGRTPTAISSSTRYDRFLPDARVTAMDSAALPGITLAEIAGRNAGVRLPGQQSGDPRRRPCSFMAYDANNRRRFVVDPSGSVAETVYDRDGTTSAIAAVRGSPEPATLTRPPSMPRSTATPSATASRDRSMMRPRACGTPSTSGSVSERRIDACGNVVTTLRWASRPTLTQHSESAVAAALATLPPANDQVTHLVYDMAHRLRFTVDATGAVSENAYDAVGNGWRRRVSRRARR